MNFNFTVGHGTQHYHSVSLRNSLPFLQTWYVRHQQRCRPVPLHPERFSLATTTNKPPQVQLWGPTGKHQVRDLCCNAGRRAERLWDGFQPCRREILQCLRHSNSYTCGVKAPKHTDKETPGQKEVITCRAEQGMWASVPQNLDSKMNKPHKTQKLRQKGKFLQNLFPFWDELICFSCLVYANLIGCYAVCSETVMHGC